jgi:hypothetical protein
MIAFSYIERNLKSLDARYNQSKSIQDANFASKLAILELCGWIEESMDDCILRASIRVLRKPKSRAFVQDKVKRNFGFEYDRHFKSMIIALVGVWGYEKISKGITPATYISFSSELDTLKVTRNSLAHTYTKGVTVQYDAPSVTLARLKILKSGFQAYDSALRTYCR